MKIAKQTNKQSRLMLSRLGHAVQRKCTSLACFKCLHQISSYHHNCYFRQKITATMARGRGRGGDDSDDSSDSSSLDSYERERQRERENKDESPDRVSDKEDGGEQEEEDSDEVSADDEAVQAFLNKHKRIDQREVTLKIKPSIVKLWFDVLLGEGRWDREARKELASKYFLSEDQYNRLSPPDLSQTRLSGLSNTFQQMHSGVRNVAKVMLKLYETQGAAELTMTKYVPTRLYEEDGVRAKEFSVPNMETLKAEVDDEAVTKLIAENDPRIIARSYLAHKKAVETAKLTIDDCFEALEATQKVATMAQDQHTKTSSFAWDVLQLLGQLDLRVKAARESQYTWFMSREFSQSLNLKIKDKEARRAKDRKDALPSDKLDKLATEEADSSSKVILIFLEESYHHSLISSLPG